MSIENIIYIITLSTPGFLSAIVIHEWAHGWMAMKFGDDTAYREGRVTLNPLAHYDLVGTVIVPLIMVIAGSYALGWARPVPINPARFKPYKKGVFWVNAAGAFANLLLAFFLIFISLLLLVKFPTFVYTETLTDMMRYGIMINLVLGIFNLIPIPPLDGSKMLAVFLPYNMAKEYESWVQYTQYLFMGLFLLSFANIGFNPFAFILYPAQALNNALAYLSLQLITLF